MGIGAQLTISGYHGFGNIDAPVFPDMMYKSNIADAVWFEPGNSRSYLILGNSSSEPIQVNVSPSATDQQSVLTVPSHATIVQLIKNDEMNQHGHANAIKSLHVSGTGVPGTLRVTGYTISDEENFVTTIRFVDPATSTEAAIYANGLHFSDGNNHLVVKNLSLNDTRISATIFPLNTNDSPESIILPTKSVSPGGTTELDLDKVVVSRDLDGAAIRIDSTGSAASVIASFTNHSRRGRIVRSSPFKDIGDYAVSTGAYPWRLDGQMSSRIYITNVGKVRAAIGAQIYPIDGPVYLIASKYLDVGETAIFDIRKLRDEEIPDPKGIILPKTAVIGQFKWSTIFGDGSQRFIGRNEVVDRQSGISASFSCNSCQCPSSTTAASLDPSSAGVYVDGDFVGINASATQVDTCSGVQLNYVFAPSSWSVASPNILSLNSGQMTSHLRGLAPGTSSFYTPFNALVYGWNGQTGSCFVASQRPLNPAGSGTIHAFSVAYSSYIPADHATTPDGCSYSGQAAEYVYMGDANRGTSRTSEYIKLIPGSSGSVSGFTPACGQTRQYGYGSPANGSTLSQLDEDNISYDCHLFNAAKTAPASGFTHSETYSTNQGQELFIGSAANPLESAAGPITWNMRTVIDATNPASPTAFVNYNHTCYPAHQVLVNGKTVYLYTPPSNTFAYIAILSRWNQ